MPALRAIEDALFKAMAATKPSKPSRRGRVVTSKPSEPAELAAQTPCTNEPAELAAQTPCSNDTSEPAELAAQINDTNGSSAIDSGYYSFESAPEATPITSHATACPANNLDSLATQGPHTDFSQTSDPLTSQNSQNDPTSILASTPQIGLPPFTVTKLKVFDKPISQATIDRFNDLHQLFEQRLFNHVFRKGVLFTTISMKLKVLGECEERATPSVVVLCDKAISKRVKQFFNQPSVKCEYRPSDPNSCLPVLNVYVLERPPRPMVGSPVDIYRFPDSDISSHTLCGTAIRVANAVTGREATLGGVIKVDWGNGKSKLFGLTAGHIFAPSRANEAGSEDNLQVKDKDKDSDSDDDFVDESSYELDFEVRLEDHQSHFEEQSQVENSQMTDPALEQCPSTWPKFGRVSVTAGDIRSQKNLDWALIELDDSSLYKPNYLVHSPKMRPPGAGDELESVLFTAGYAYADRTVVLLDRSGNCRQGKLKCARSCLIVAPGQSFIETHDLVLPAGSEIRPGDCGSWVVGAYSNMVYGHVVASDVLGDAYVVPLTATFEDIKEKLGAHFVWLPTHEEVDRWTRDNFNASGSYGSAELKSRKVHFSNGIERVSPASTSKGVDSDGQIKVRNTNVENVLKKSSSTAQYDAWSTSEETTFVEDLLQQQQSEVDRLASELRASYDQQNILNQHITAKEALISELESQNSEKICHIRNLHDAISNLNSLHHVGYQRHDWDDLAAELPYMKQKIEDVNLILKKLRLREDSLRKQEEYDSDEDVSSWLGISIFKYT